MFAAFLAVHEKPPRPPRTQFHHKSWTDLMTSLHSFQKDTGQHFDTTCTAAKLKPQQDIKMLYFYTLQTAGDFILCQHKSWTLLIKLCHLSCIKYKFPCKQTTRGAREDGSDCHFTARDVFMRGMSKLHSTRFTKYFETSFKDVLGKMPKASNVSIWLCFDGALSSSEHRLM